MTSKSTGPNLLYAVVEGWTVDELRSQFGRRRITVATCKSPPSWSRAFDGHVFDVQTLYGEYGGFVGSSITSSKETGTTETSMRHWQLEKSQSLSATTQCERDDNIRKMLEVLAELTQRGRVVLYLSIPALGASTSPKPGKLSVECLLRMSPNVPVVFERLTA